jgi:hypothetical protein
MDYFKQINDLRNELHKKIVHRAILAADAGSYYYLELSDPLEACYCIRSRESNHLETTQVIVTGINGTTGELVAETANGTPKRLYYHDLTLEQLATLLRKLETNFFTIIKTEDVRYTITAGT